MRRIILALALASCTNDAACPLPESSNPPTDAARCVAHVALSEASGACTLTVAVDFDCDPSTQRYTWARVGWLRDGDVGGFIDTTYACGATTSHAFAVECDGACYAGGATFDGPTDQADIDCIASM